MFCQRKIFILYVPLPKNLLQVTPLNVAISIASDILYARLSAIRRKPLVFLRSLIIYSFLVVYFFSKRNLNFLLCRKKSRIHKYSLYTVFHCVLHTVRTRDDNGVKTII